MDAEQRDALIGWVVAFVLGAIMWFAIIGTAYLVVTS